MATTLAPGTPALDRAALLDWYRRNRERSARLFALVDEPAFYDRPIPLRLPFAFYEGHIPAFSHFTLCEHALHEEPVDREYEAIFDRGIDPDSLDKAQSHDKALVRYPSREEVAAFAARCDERVERAISHGRIDNPDEPRLVGGQAAYAILEHEEMHDETLMYIVHQLDYERKGRFEQVHHDHAVDASGGIEIPAGVATLGADLSEIRFGWDNELGRHTVDVPRFSISTYPVTNAQYVAFVRAGGPPPPFWIEREGEWFLKGQFEELPLPGSWPVYVSHDLASAYALWAGGRLPSEAEYHRAAFGTPSGDERAFPWGGEAPGAEHGNFDFQRYDPEPVDAHPAGASAWGVYDLVGNGWEWTSTPFMPFEGFVPTASYPRYSADFFDGKHFVMKGASPVTARELVRRSWRNWFYHDYPYTYAKFRCVTP